MLASLGVQQIVLFSEALFTNINISPIVQVDPLVRAFMYRCYKDNAIIMQMVLGLLVKTFVGEMAYRSFVMM